MGKKIRPRISQAEYEALLDMRKNKSDNTLVIGDLHAPFVKKGYLEFCQNTSYKYKCSRVVFIGDIIDNHYSSYYEADPDGHSAAEELRRAKEKISN